MYVDGYTLSRDKRGVACWIVCVEIGIMKIVEEPFIFYMFDCIFQLLEHIPS